MAEQKKTVEATIRNIHRATLKKYNAEEKVCDGKIAGREYDR